MNVEQLKLSSKCIFLVFYTFMLFSWSVANDDAHRGDDKSLSCSNVLSFDIGQRRRLLKILPEELQHLPLTKNLEYLLNEVSRHEPNNFNGKNIFVIELSTLEADQLKTPEIIESDNYFNFPEQLLSREEWDDYTNLLKFRGVNNVIENSRKIPLIKTNLISNIKLIETPYQLAVSDNGEPLMLVPVHYSKHLTGIKTKQNLTFLLSNLINFSDAGVTSKVLGLSYNSEGVLCVIYPLMASYYDIDLRAFKVGLDIIIGKNPVEPFDYNAEVRRIEPFEQLVDRLKQSQWPLLDLSLDFEQFQQNEFEVSFDSLFSELTTQIWQLFKNQNENTFLNVANLFSNNNSAWIPSLHDSATQLLRPDIDPNLFHLRLLKDDGVGLIERLAYVPLENIEHSSKFGRLTLLRYKFMLSLLNPQAKWKYFDILKAKDPRAFESLNELIFFIAGKVGPEKIKSFLSSYNANKRREAFQIFDNRLEQ